MNKVANLPNIFLSKIALILCLPVALIFNQSGDKNYRSAKQSFPPFLLLGFLALLGNPVLCLATTCGDSTPEELISQMDLIFKGKVIGTKKLFLDKYDITVGFEKIWTQSEIDNQFNYEELVKLIKPYVNAKDFQKLAEQPHFILSELISTRAKFKVLVSYKGPIVDEIEVESASGKIGEEKMVFAYGNLIKGYRTYRCAGFSYWWASENGDQSYQAALDAYRQKREQLITALRFSPHNPALLKEQGALYLQFHDFDSAEWAYQELRLHHPKDVAGLVGLADVRLNRAQHEYNDKKTVLYEQALAGYENILKIDRNNHVARHGETLALLYLERESEVDKNARDFSGYVSDSNNADKINRFFAARNLKGANFRNAKLRGINFSNVDLRYADFTGAYLNGCNFTGAKLTHAKFRQLKEAYHVSFAEANLQYADFTEAHASEADFPNANLQGVSFLRADLSANTVVGSGANLTNANLQGADFSQADLSTVTLTRANINKAKFIGTKFNGANLSGLAFIDQDFTNVELLRTDFRKASFIRTKISVIKNGLTETNFSDADFHNMDFSNLTMEGCNFSGAKLKKANFSGATLLESRFEKAYLEGADFTRAELKQARFKSAFIDNVKFNDAQLFDSDFEEIVFKDNDFSGADLRGVNLKKTSFKNTRLFGAVFGTKNSYFHTDLRGADLSNVTMGDIIKSGMVYADCHTKFPKGYTSTILQILPMEGNCRERAPKKTPASGIPSWFDNPNRPNSDFSGRYLSYSEMLGIRFDGSNFSKTNMEGVQIDKGSYLNTHFEDANLTKAELSNAPFIGASFKRANLSYALLKNVDFTSATFTEAILTGLCFDSKTKWPIGFDPTVAGGRQIDSKEEKCE